MLILLHRRSLCAALVLVFLTAATTQRLVAHAQTFHAARSFGVGSSKGRADIKLAYPTIVSAPSIATRLALNRVVLDFVLSNYFGASRKTAASPQALATDFFRYYANEYAGARKLHIFAQSYLLDRACE